jgi:hypothetical protein
MDLTVNTNTAYTFFIELQWSVPDFGYHLVELRIRTNDEDSITAIGLRSLKLTTLMRTAVRQNVRREDGTKLQPHLNRFEKALSTDADRLKLVAETYAIARAYGEPPLKAVADGFKVSQSTATRWAAQARTSGLLD